MWSRVKLEVIRTSVSKVPFVYHDVPTNKQHDMLFCGGITCITQDEYQGTLEPNGWAVLLAEAHSFLKVISVETRH